jgi:phosphoenolpyruvate synthase/pyruvate phosphate dikinase
MKRFGDASATLLVAVRSGAPASMPGMDTILNLGLNHRTCAALRRAVGQRAVRVGLLPPLRRDVRRGRDGGGAERAR